MGTNVRAGLVAALACGALITACQPGDNDGSSAPSSSPLAARTTTGGVPKPTTPAWKGPYVALGDSYTAGPGIPDQSGEPAGCERSSRNYPALVAQELNLKGAAFRDMSCSGATTSDLAGAQTTDDGTNKAQLTALSASTRLVTVGVGGNDIGFSSLITQCVKRGAFYYATGKDTFTGDNAPCRTLHTSGGTDEIREKIQTAADRLSNALNDIKNRAPRADIYVVGYPAILPSEDSSCDDLVLAPGDVTYLRQKEQQLNTMLRQKAKAAGAGYIDTYTPSTGRDACSAAGARWVEPLIPSSPAAPIHPNERGERGMADAVLNAVKAS